MRKFEEYMTASSVEDDYKELCNPELAEAAPETNDLVINLIAKYLASYLDVAELTHQKLSDAIQDNVFDDFSMSCVADIRSTAALMKEVIFADNYEKKDKFVGVDYGSGTGILTLAMAINASRHQIKNITCVGFDKEEAVLEKAEETMDFVDADIRFYVDDITDKTPYDWIARREPSMIVSETINTSIHEFHVSDEGKVVSAIDNAIENMFDSFHADIDPYKFVVSQILRQEGYYEKIKQGKMYLFPDIINGKMIIDGSDSRIYLRDYPNPKALESFRRELFSDYEDFGQTRWPDRNDVEGEGNQIEDMLKNVDWSKFKG